MDKSKRLTSILDSVIDYSAVLAGAMIFFMMLAVSAEVVMRYFVRRPMLWVVDISEIILVYSAFLAATWVLKLEGHVMVEVVYNRLSPKVQGLLNVVTSILGVVVCAILAWFSGQATWDSFRHGVTILGGIDYPKFIILAPIPIGSFLLAIQFVLGISATDRGRTTGTG